MNLCLLPCHWRKTYVRTFRVWVCEYVLDWRKFELSSRRARPLVTVQIVRHSWIHCWGIKHIQSDVLHENWPELHTIQRPSFCFANLLSCKIGGFRVGPQGSVRPWRACRWATGAIHCTRTPGGWGPILTPWSKNKKKKILRRKVYIFLLFFSVDPPLEPPSPPNPVSTRFTKARKEQCFARPTSFATSNLTSATSLVRCWRARIHWPNFNKSTTETLNLEYQKHKKHSALRKKFKPQTPTKFARLVVSSVLQTFLSLGAGGGLQEACKPAFRPLAGLQGSGPGSSASQAPRHLPIIDQNKRRLSKRVLTTER